MVCETLRFPHFLHNRLTNVGKIVTLTRRQPFTPRKIPGTHFCQKLSRPQGHSAAGRIRSTEKSNDLIRNRTRDLLACSIAPQPTTLLRVPLYSGSAYANTILNVTKNLKIKIRSILTESVIWIRGYVQWMNVECVPFYEQPIKFTSCSIRV
jgi:hypothetical protein